MKKKQVRGKSYDRISDVMDIRQVDNVLLVGYPKMSFITKVVHETSVAEDVPFAVKQHYGRHFFTKVFVTDDGSLDDDDVGSLIYMNTGLMFIDVSNVDKKRETELMEMIEDQFWPSLAWSTDTALGRCIVTEAHGYPHQYRVPASSEGIDSFVENWMNVKA